MNCIPVGYWRNPMEFLTLLLFVSIFVFFAVQFLQKLQWQYLLFAVTSFVISWVVYSINYKPQICWNEEVIVYQNGNKERVELAWSDIEVVGGVAFGKYSCKQLSREELTQFSFFTRRDIYITTEKKPKTMRTQFYGDDVIVFQYRPGLLETVEKLSGKKANLEN